MIEKVNSLPEEQANLHIVENMDVNNLPELLKNVLSLAQTPAEQDMLLMATLSACSSVMPNLSAVHCGLRSLRQGYRQPCT